MILIFQGPANTKSCMSQDYFSGKSWGQASLGRLWGQADLTVHNLSQRGQIQKQRRLWVNWGREKANQTVAKNLNRELQAQKWLTKSRFRTTIATWIRYYWRIQKLARTCHHVWGGRQRMKEPCLHKNSVWACIKSPMRRLWWETAIRGRSAYQYRATKKNYGQQWQQQKSSAVVDENRDLNLSERCMTDQNPEQNSEPKIV